VRQYSSFSAHRDRRPVSRPNNINVPDRSIEDLPKCGRTELVRITLALKTLNAEDFAPQARQMLSKFGSAIAIPQTNQLLLSDKAGTLVRFVNRTCRGSKPAKEARRTLSKSANGSLPAKAERTLKEMFGLATATAAAPAATGGAMDPRAFGRGRFDGGAGGFDPNQFNPAMMFDPRMRGVAPAAQPASRGGPIHVSCDERTNTVLRQRPR